MRKWVRIAVVVFLAAMAGAVAWQVLSLREPVYQGKGLSVWLVTPVLVAKLRALVCLEETN